MKSSLRARLTLSICSLVICLGGLEWTGRACVPSQQGQPPGMAPDPIRGWRLPANTVLLWRGGPAHINSLGLRGEEPDPDAALRVLFVGDSSVFGDGVGEEETMVARLSESLGAQVDVQNGGVPGYTCWQSLALISELRDSFQPDILISYNQNSDYRLASKQDRAVIESQLGVLAKTGIGRLVSSGSLWLRIWRGRSVVEVEEYRSCLRAMALGQQEAGGSMLFVVPFVDVDFVTGGVEGEGAVSQSLEIYRSTMTEVAEETGSLLVEGAVAADAAGLVARTALVDPVHPSAAGHQVLADAVAAALEGSGWLR